MSLKSVLRLSPILFKPSSINNVCVRLNKNVTTTYYLCNQPARLYSTEKPSKSHAGQTIQIYEGVLATKIKLVKMFSLSTSVMGLLAQPIFYKQLIALQNVPLLVVGYTFIGFFTVLTPLLLHFITKKYVMTIDYNPETKKYTSTTLNLFCFPKRIEFSPDDVHVPDVPGMFTTFHVKGVPLFCEPTLFEDPSHYSKIMGYDKPIDFKLYEGAIKQSNEK